VQLRAKGMAENKARKATESICPTIRFFESLPQPSGQRA